MTTHDEHGAAYDGNGRRLDQIRLSGIAATGYHGVFEHERREGQTFVADVVVHLDTRRAAAGDDLAHTLDYGVLAQQVAAVLAGEPVDLVETLAERIAATVLAAGAVQAVDVAVHKPQAPIPVPFGDVVVAIRRDRTKLPAAEPYTGELPSAPRALPATPPAGHAAPLPVGHLPAPPAGVVAPVALPATPPSGHVAPPPGGPSSGPVDGPLDETAVLPAMPALPPPGPVAPGPAAPTPGLVGAGPVPFGAPGPDVSTGSPSGALTGASWDPSATQVMPGPVPAYDEPEGVVTGEIVTDALDDAPAEPVEVVLALGANLGAAQETLRDAVSDLAATRGVEVTDVSPLARTAAVGPEQPDYLNAVVLARTTLSPRELLRATQAVENAHGRERAERWGPRTLDIDIVVYGSVLAVTDDLELPHPRAHERAFVLEPWSQLDPDAILPGLGGGPVAALAATAPDRGGVRWLALDWLTAPVPGTSGVPVVEAPVRDSVFPPDGYASAADPSQVPRTPSP